MVIIPNTVMDLYWDWSVFAGILSALLYIQSHTAVVTSELSYILFTVEVILEGFFISINRMTNDIGLLYLPQHCTVHRVSLHELYLYEYFFSMVVLIRCVF